VGILSNQAQRQAQRRTGQPFGGPLGGQRRTPDPGILEEVLQRRVGPAAKESTSRSRFLFGKLENRLNTPFSLDPIQGAATAFAEDLLRPEGEISQQISSALRSDVQSGFNPAGGGAFEARQGQISRGVQDRLANFLAQQTLGLRQQNIQETLGLGQLALGSQELDLATIVSLFTGQASAEQLRLALQALKAQT
jgi:hypothetical protein